MTPQFSVIILGQKGVGKSTFGNILLGLQPECENSFIVNSPNNDACRRAIGSARQCATVSFNTSDDDHNPQEMSLEIIDTPGLDAPNPDGYQHKWRDLVHAFDMSTTKRVVFIILIKADDGKNGEKVVKTFVDMYGHEGLSRCLVVFMRNQNPFRKNAMRYIQIEHFEYLLQLLKTGFPYYVWRTDGSKEQQRQEILTMISDISDHNEYTREDFTNAQESYTMKAVKKFKADNKLRRPVTKEQLQSLGVPDICIGRYLRESFFSDVQKVFSHRY